MLFEEPLTEFDLDFKDDKDLGDKDPDKIFNATIDYCEFLLEL